MIAEGLLETSRRIYDAATENLYRQREAGGIIPEDDLGERAAGARWKAITPEGRMALGAWQKAKAELDHWHGYVPRNRRAKPQPPDPRLPPERDEELSS